MSDEITILADRRTETGTTACRRIRKQGRIPANMYGHNLAPVSLTITEDDLRPVLATGHRVVDLKLDGGVQKALIRELRWDTFGMQVQHVDFLRVDATERMTVEVPVVLRGTAQGVLSGGILEQPLHTLTIEAPAIQIPDQIVLRVNELQIGESIHASDITDLPPEVTIETPLDQVVVHVLAAKVVEEEEPAEGEVLEQPEVIGRKTEEEGEEG